MRKTDETLPWSIITYLIDFTDTIVLMYIGMVIPPFDHYSSFINRNIRQHLIKWGIALPSSYASGNFLGYYSRAALLVVPTVMLLATTRQRILPSLLILLNYLWGIFDNTDYFTTTNTSSSGFSNDERFHVLSTGSAQSIPSWTYLQRSKRYTDFIKSISGKVYLLPIWIILLSVIASEASPLKALQFLVMWILVFVEVVSMTTNFQSFFTTGGSAPLTLKNLDFGNSCSRTSIDKANYTFQMVGTFLLVMPFFRWVGLALLLAAIPLSYKQARGDMTNRALYVDGTYDVIDHKILQFWMQAKQLGSNLTVGVTYSSTETSHTNDMILNACAVNAVDRVIAEAPRHLDLKFLTKFGIDYVVVCSALKNNKFANFLSDEIYENRKIIAVDDNGVAYPLLSKNALKAD